MDESDVYQQMLANINALYSTGGLHRPNILASLNLESFNTFTELSKIEARSLGYNVEPTTDIAEARKYSPLFDTIKRLSRRAARAF